MLGRNWFGCPWAQSPPNKGRPATRNQVYIRGQSRCLWAWYTSDCSPPDANRRGFVCRGQCQGGHGYKRNGQRMAILILGPLLKEEDQSILEYDLIPSLSNREELKRFKELSSTKGAPIPIHLKIDTGMGRMGCWWEQAPGLLEDIIASPEVDLQGVLTHFPLPQDSTFTDLQRERFLSVVQPALSTLPNLLVHADNSSSLQTMDRDSPFNGIRIGLLQFGIAPPRESVLAGIDVEPVLSFHSRLALVKDLPAGASLSYGCEKILERDSRIGVIAAGYGDAIPLHCGAKHKV